MIVDAYNIADDQPAFEASFQEQMLSHWRQIQNNRRFPDKRKFRPQNFPKFLPQLAMVSMDHDKKFDDRLTGETVSEVLRLEESGSKLVRPADAGIRAIVETMLEDATRADGPLYFKGSFKLSESSSVDFTALILPFSHDDMEDEMDTLMLAFNFSRKNGTPFTYPNINTSRH